MNEHPTPIYLDHNATTPIAPEVVEAMLPYLTEHFGNPSSDHPYGRAAARAVQRARVEVAALLGCSPGQILFTSGGTEANNLAVRGIAARSDRRRIVTSVVEHPATARPCELLASRGWDVVRAGVDGDCRVDLDQATAALTGDTALATMIHANNETGTLQPIAEIAAAAHAVGALVHADAAQSVGKLEVAVDDLGVDLLSVAGHKLYGPKGVGALFVRDRQRLAPLVVGAGHEDGLRPGTENVASIVGLGAACRLARLRLAGTETGPRARRDDLWRRLQAEIPGIAINGHPDHRLPNTLNARLPGISGNALLAAVPEIAASTGSACHAGEESASAVLLAMGIDRSAALGSVRLSLGHGTTPAMIERAAAALIRGWKTLQQGQGLAGGQPSP